MTGFCTCPVANPKWHEDDCPQAHPFQQEAAARRAEDRRKGLGQQLRELVHEQDRKRVIGH